MTCYIDKAGSVRTEPSSEAAASFNHTTTPHHSENDHVHTTPLLSVLQHGSTSAPVTNHPRPAQSTCWLCSVQTANHSLFNPSFHPTTVTHTLAHCVFSKGPQSHPTNMRVSPLAVFCRLLLLLLCAQYVLSINRFWIFFDESCNSNPYRSGVTDTVIQVSLQPLDIQPASPAHIAHSLTAVCLPLLYSVCCCVCRLCTTWRWSAIWCRTRASRIG